MARPRFFLDAEISNDSIQLPSKQAHHAERTLRLAAGEPVVVFNGSGSQWSGKIAFREKSVFVDELKKEESNVESPIKIILVQSLVNPEKMDWIVEKAVEAGVSEVHLIPAARSVTKLSGERLAKRIAKLEDAVVSASEQCGRNLIMKISAHASLKKAFESIVADEKILLAPGSTQKADLSAESKSVALAVGPEGGFSPEEIDLAQSLGWKSLLLGPRVLRTETAGLAAAVWVNTKIGDF